MPRHRRRPFVLRQRAPPAQRARPIDETESFGLRFSIVEAHQPESRCPGIPAEDTMRTSDVAAVALAVMSMLSPGAAGAAELTVLAGMGVVSGVRDVALAFER